MDDFIRTLLWSGVPVAVLLWALTYVPGPWRWFVEGAAKNALESARQKYSETAEAEAEIAVLNAEVAHKPSATQDAAKRARANDAALQEALDHMERQLEMDAEQARPYIEAALLRLKDEQLVLDTKATHYDLDFDDLANRTEEQQRERIKSALPSQRAK